MSRDNLPAYLVESLIFWSEEDLREDNADEITKDDDPDAAGEDKCELDGDETTADDKQKGKEAERRQSMYVGLFEGELYLAC